MMHRFKLRFDGRGIQLMGVADVYGQDKPEWSEDLLRKTLALTFPGDQNGVQITLTQTMDEAVAPDPRGDDPCLTDEADAPNTVAETMARELRQARADLAAMTKERDMLRMTELPVGWVAAPKAEWDMARWLERNVRKCDHGYIHITCGDCNHMSGR